MLKRSIFGTALLAAAIVLTLPVGNAQSTLVGDAAPGASVSGASSAASPSIAALSKAVSAHATAVQKAAARAAAATKADAAKANAAASNGSHAANSSTESAIPGPNGPRTASVTDGGAPAVQPKVQSHGGRSLASATKSVSSSTHIGVHTASTNQDCSGPVSGTVPGAPGTVDPSGVQGTTTADLQAFADEYNALRVANCLPPIPFSNIRYDSCLQERMFWMADDPSTNPASAWGHTGVAKRSDGVPIVGCDGDLAGGMGDTGSSDALAWWNSIDHRDSLYQPLYKGSVANVCIGFAITHGGVPNESTSFTRAAARWESC